MLAIDEEAFAADAGAVNLRALAPVAGPQQMAEKAHKYLAGGVRLVHGGEEVEISYGAPVRRVVHLTGGLQSRRGLCGLLRVDFREMSQGISYRIRATR